MYMKLFLTLLTWSLVLAFHVTGSAMSFRLGQAEGLFDVSLAYGILARVEDRDENIIAISSGGTAEAANFDDGTLNYDRGIVSHMVKTTGELAVKSGIWGIYARGYAFYDFENQGRERARTELSCKAERMISEDADLLEYYLSVRFQPAGVPVQFRLGDQVVRWGESTYLYNGVDVINPLDLVAAAQPVSTLRDLFIPQGMLWGAANVTEDFSVEAFYQYKWEPLRLDPIGTFFSQVDLVGGDGTGFVVLGAGRISDLGTELDEMFRLPAGTIGFDEDYMKMPGRGERSASDGGQYGVTLQTLIPAWNAAKLALHFVRYHSRLSILSGRTADQATVDGTSEAAVEARAAPLIPIYEATGLTPEEAASRALQTAADLTVSGYANRAGYIVEYPEDITMIGFSFNTSTVRTGTLVAGEVSHHFDFPLQIDVDTVIGATLSPIQFDPSFGQSLLGAFGADDIVRGYIRRDKTQSVLGIKQLLGPRLGASQSLISVDGGWIHIHRMPAHEDIPLQAIAVPDADSWGYRVIGQLNYSGLLGGVNLKPRIVWTHDIDGTTPGGGFVEGRKSISIGLNTDWINHWSSDLSYTNFFGAGSNNLINDRDYVRFNVIYSF
jgi:hypothetical protein